MWSLFSCDWIASVAEVIKPRLVTSEKQRQNPCFRPLSVYEDLSARHDLPVKEAIVDLPIRLEGNLKRISGSPLSPWRTQKQGSRRCCADVTIRVNLRLRPRLDPLFQPAFLSHKIADNTRWKGGKPDGTPSELKKRAPSKHLALLFFFQRLFGKTLTFTRWIALYSFF